MRGIGNQVFVEVAQIYCAFGPFNLSMRMGNGMSRIRFDKDGDYQTDPGTAKSGIRMDFGT